MTFRQAILIIEPALLAGVVGFFGYQICRIITSHRRFMLHSRNCEDAIGRMHKASNLTQFISAHEQSEAALEEMAKEIKK